MNIEEKKADFIRRFKASLAAETRKVLDVNKPSLINVSRSMKYGFPANVENDWYGESPYPVGPKGKICQNV